ncbi:MAG: TIGR03086 family metal-binding protein [Actinomycetes bacterium]
MSQPGADLLESVLDETEATLAAVRPDQAHLPTPCPDFDVARLTDHVVGWAVSFASRLTDGLATGDPNDYRVGSSPATEFHRAAQSLIRSYREATEESQQLPVGFMIMEFLTHGWDLATATGRRVTYSPDAAELALDTGRLMLKPEYRGPGMTFGAEVEVAGTAGAVDRLIAFMGRDPAWQASTT